MMVMYVFAVWLKRMGTTRGEGRRYDQIFKRSSDGSRAKAGIDWSSDMFGSFSARFEECC